VISDSGVDMTRQQLKDNLGTIAKSGTSEFLANVENSNNDTISQIGQFGVGFYSVFLVANKVTVASKLNEDQDQYIWQSTAVNDFTLQRSKRKYTWKVYTNYAALERGCLQVFKEKEFEGIGSQVFTIYYFSYYDLVC
jgi:heat shock protein beta